MPAEQKAEEASGAASQLQVDHVHGADLGPGSAEGQAPAPKARKAIRRRSINPVDTQADYTDADAEAAPDHDPAAYRDINKEGQASS